MSAVKVGDRVKVTIEGTVERIHNDEVCVELDGDDLNAYAYLGPSVEIQRVDIP